jgi:hypothetical protein
MAASVTTCQAIWLAGLLGEILGAGLSVPRLKVDNKAAIDLIRNPIHHERSKHIRICYHFVRECAAKGGLKHIRICYHFATILFITTGDQLTDILTKPLQRVKFLEMQERIGVLQDQVKGTLLGRELS